MPELLRIQTSDFELTIWCSDISKRQATYYSTLEKRKACSIAGRPTYEVRFSPPLALTDIAINEAPFIPDTDHPNLEADQNLANPYSVTATDKLKLDVPLFFENIQYQFEWVFSADATDEESTLVSDAYLTHRSHQINESFRFAKAKRSAPSRLTGTINTANHVGWMRLPLSYSKSGHTHHSSISFEVLPTKMSLHDDLPAMYRTIDELYPLWRFSLVEKTEQDAARHHHSQHFPLFWLASFGQLRTKLEQALKVISQTPHSRLQSYTTRNKASRLKGNIPKRVGHKIREDFANGRQDKHYQVTKKQLSVDTPENRFIKMVVATSKRRLADFESKLRISNQAPDNQRLSEAFLQELHQWQRPLQETLSQDFMRDVGDYRGLSRESLVLQQKVGYSAVYRIWQELKFYLDLFDQQASVSMKSVAEIYEVWCFLTLRNILIDDLGFKEITVNKSSLTLNSFYEYRFTNDLMEAFEFERDDGAKVKLVHEHKFKKIKEDKNNIKIQTGIHSYLVSHKPDILLEITLPKPNNKRFIWLFDAKYRIKTRKTDDDDSNIETTDWVPDDAINQMHRYRDALIHLENTNDQKLSTAHKSRPVFGAFALYPGYFDQLNSNNPYEHAISEVGIGAFALLPSAMGSEQKSISGHHWLLNFLKDQIGPKLSANYEDSSPLIDNEVNSPATIYRTGKQTYTSDEKLYLQDAARIPFAGMQQVLYPDLTMTISLGNEAKRDSQYFDMFKKGLAQWYHLPVKTFDTKYERHIASELRYLALATSFEDQPDSKQISMVWPIKKVWVKKRFEINLEQAGKSSDSEDEYYLFKLGKPLILLNKITGIPTDSFTATIKLTTLSLLQEANVFNDLRSVYQDTLVKSNDDIDT